MQIGLPPAGQLLAGGRGERTLNPDPADQVASGVAAAAVEQLLDRGSHRTVLSGPPHHPLPAFQCRLITMSARVGSWPLTEDRSTQVCHVVGRAWRPHPTQDQSGVKRRHDSLYIHEIIETNWYAIVRA